MPTSDVDVPAILDTLKRHEVAYVVIGGFAAELHDVAIPPTRAIDLTPSPAPKNLERLAAALRQLDARFRVPDGPPAGVDIPGGITAEWLTDLVTVTLTTTAGPLDIALRPDGTEGFDDLIRDHVVISYADRPVPVASLADVIRSKEAAGRAKDLLVIPALRAHLRRLKGRTGS
ncbi:MAG: hypothetical protein IH941_04265 [Acidobacteria bacterium]|nr:hypothetical protein [Acidobacteriota bacterium]